MIQNEKFKRNNLTLKGHGGIYPMGLDCELGPPVPEQSAPTSRASLLLKSDFAKNII